MRTAFTTAFQMEEVDNEARIFELRLKLANLKQGETENIAKFIARADILAKELPGSQINDGMAMTRGIFDPEHKERLLLRIVLHSAVSRRWSKRCVFLDSATVLDFCTFRTTANASRHMVTLLTSVLSLSVVPTSVVCLLGFCVG